jgi:GNAT superfamily N-acetyltransferase
MAIHRTGGARIHAVTVSLSIEFVDPLDVLADAASVLQEAWAAPSFHHSSDYLGWQFTFPSPLPRVAAVARSGDEIAGFMGITPRRIGIGSWTGTAGVLSFLAVRPTWRGRRIAEQLYGVMLGRARELEIPMLTFAEVGTVGEHLLVKEYDRAGFIRHNLGNCQPYACLPRGNAADDIETGTVDATDLLALVKSANAGVRLAPEVEHLRHYAADPRWRRAFLATDGEHSVGAMAVAAEMNTARGIETILTVDVSLTASDSPHLLKRIAIAAAEAYPSATSQVVFPNLILPDADRARGAGLRKLPARYVVYLCVTDKYRSLCDAEPVGTNVDVV